MKHARGSYFGRFMAAHMALTQEPTIQRDESRAGTFTVLLLAWALILLLFVVSP